MGGDDHLTAFGKPPRDPPFRLWILSWAVVFPLTLIASGLVGLVVYGSCGESAPRPGTGRERFCEAIGRAPGQGETITSLVFSLVPSIVYLAVGATAIYVGSRRLLVAAAAGAVLAVVVQGTLLKALPG